MIDYKELCLDKSLKDHLYIQLFRQLKNQILSAKLLAGEKLPPIRKLSETLKVNNVTIVNAYKLLEEGGYVYKKIGSGTFVSEIKYSLASEEEESDFVINFASASPSADLFPVELFKESINKALDRDMGNAFSYQELKGYLPLRQSLSGYLESINIDADPESIHVISGAQQGIDIVSKGLIDYGDYVIVESPTYTGALASLNLKGANILEVPLLTDGPNIAVLKKLIGKYRPKLLYVMPNFHNPTGISYSYEKKKELLSLADKYEFKIIEDDFSSDLYFDSKFPVTLKSLDKNNKVIYIKSFSKVLMPGLRLGFMVAPTDIEKQIMFAKHTSDISTSGLIQRAFDIFLRSGYLSVQVDKIRAEYKSRYFEAIEILEKKNKKIMKCDFPDGGLNFWVEIPEGLDSDVLVRKVNSKGVKVVSGKEFYSSKARENFIRLSISTQKSENLAKGIDIIYDELVKYLNDYNSVADKKSFIPTI
ncbi:MAG: PLP-dependent aminotransferase family protein [Acidaminobacteraceae bacterium]